MTSDAPKPDDAPEPAAPKPDAPGGVPGASAAAPAVASASVERVGFVGDVVGSLRAAFALRRDPSFLVRVLLGFSCIGFVLLVWHALTTGDIVEERTLGPAVLPSIGEVAGSLPGLISDRGLFASISASLTRVFLGFGLACLVGITFGMIAGAWRPLSAFMAPMVIFGRNIPIAALIPLTLVWFGIDESQKVLFLFLATVPFVFSSASSAISAIHERYVETAQTLGATRLQIFRKVLVPLAAPQIFNDQRQLFGLAFGYIMLAELVNAKRGLGHLINLSQRRSTPEDILMILVIIGLLAYTIDRTLAWFQRGIFPYRKDL